MQEVLGDGSFVIEHNSSQQDTKMESSPPHGTGKNLAGDFDEANDDLLEEGEAPQGNLLEEDEVALGQGNVVLTGMGSGNTASTEDDLEGEGNKQKGTGKQGNKAVEGKPAGGGIRPVKKGMVALPKPPAKT
ncbi:PREDICTED: uncharacterized protein LOC104770541 [Camelina sativa]|uniref:Uncharacterized protein LOC104770541 n=1 Tax=Camelina sativa TaxID=90675 RepID=A0ABM0XZN3_CAMSA|nr:PREDICTED: uncharacterized protein LOC104770541 [Camelina sativa]